MLHQLRIYKIEEGKFDEFFASGWQASLQSGRRKGGKSSVGSAREERASLDFELRLHT